MEWKKTGSSCPLCGLNDIERGFDGDRSRLKLKCYRCGRFDASDHFITASLDFPPRPLLSGLARQYEDRDNVLYLTYENSADLERLAPSDVSGKVLALLQALGRKSGHPGVAVPINQARDYPLAFAQNTFEFGMYLQHLIDSGFVHHTQSPNAPWAGILTIAGWNAIEAAKRPNAESDQAFVAMCFNPELDPVYHGAIKLAIKDAGYDPVRIDLVEHTDNIDDALIAAIRQSRFIVADFTENRPGVYYEAGFAKGLGLEAIFTCREDHMKCIHFDTRQYPHIVWTSLEELRKRLQVRIVATVGKGPRKP